MTIVDSDGLVCTACRRKLAYDKFQKKQQKYSLKDKRCIECIDDLRTGYLLKVWQEWRMAKLLQSVEQRPPCPLLG